MMEMMQWMETSPLFTVLLLSTGTAHRSLRTRRLGPFGLSKTYHYKLLCYICHMTTTPLGRLKQSSAVISTHSKKEGGGFYVPGEKKTPILSSMSTYTYNSQGLPYLSVVKLESLDHLFRLVVQGGMQDRVPAL